MSGVIMKDRKIVERKKVKYYKEREKNRRDTKIIDRVEEKKKEVRLYDNADF